MIFSLILDINEIRKGNKLSSMDCSPHQKSLNNIKLFTDVLFNQRDSLKPLGTAFSLVSNDLNIGRVMGDIPSSATNSELMLLAENRLLYMSDRGFDPKNSIRFSFRTLSDVKGEFVVSPIPDHEFDDEEKEIINILLQIADIHICRYFAISQIEESSRTQALTGLPNADSYMRIIRKKSADNTLDNYDAYYFNLSNFGLINKRFGSREADRIMARYANELKMFIRPTEAVGHLGGDNYVALIEKDHSEDFRDFIDGVEVKGHLDDGEIVDLKISALAGFMHVKTPISLGFILSGPAIALANAKAHKIKVVELTEEMNNLAIRAKSIEQNFEKSLANNEFTVYYQPKVNSVTGRIIGAEALVRWFENGRMVSPLSFVPILEKSGKIAQLDLFMLETVCKDIHDWKKAGRQSVPCSVNFSRRDLADSDLPNKIMNIINKYGILSSEIIIEVTETASESEKELMKVFLGNLHNNGISTSIDDFGTGYSSLSALKDYPINEIKIDKSFIDHGLDVKDEIIVRNIIDMAKKLNIDVITEGVELIMQKDFLHKLGCDRVQGFLYDKPLPKDKFEERLLIGEYSEIQNYKDD